MSEAETQKAVRFTRNAPPYFKGDTAVFAAKVADRIVRQGSAEHATVPAAEPPAEKLPMHTATIAKFVKK